MEAVSKMTVEADIAQEEVIEQYQFPPGLRSAFRGSAVRFRT